jgi:prolyl-tRNA synthetase
VSLDSNKPEIAAVADSSKAIWRRRLRGAARRSRWPEPGVKFKDADLLGMPLRLTVGARGLKDGSSSCEIAGRKK